MKKVASLLMAVLMLCTMLTVFALPAFAEDAPKEITMNSMGVVVQGNCIISKPGEYSVKLLLLVPDSRLTIGEGVTLMVTEGFQCLGEIELLGTLYIGPATDADYYPEMIKVGKTGTFIDKTLLEIEEAIVTASALSEGSLTIIVGVAAAVVFGLGGFFIGKAAEKKKKPALADGADNADEE